MTAEQRLIRLGVQLPPPPQPVAMYQPVVVVGGMAYVSGQGPTADGRPVYTGLVGRDLDEEEAVRAARLCAVNALAALRAHLGTLDAVARIVKVLGFVASAPGFHDQPLVMNGASALLNDVFPDGHARSAIGTSSLPYNIPVEVELVAQLVDSEPQAP